MIVRKFKLLLMMADERTLTEEEERVSKFYKENTILGTFFQLELKLIFIHSHKFDENLFDPFLFPFVFILTKKQHSHHLRHISDILFSKHFNVESEMFVILVWKMVYKI